MNGRLGRKLLRLGLILGSLGLLLSLPLTARVQDNSALQLYKLINKARLAEGLPPLGWSKLLEQAANRHADDMASNGNASTEGSDGSAPRQRIRETGYRAWYDGLLVQETVWMGLGTANDALAWFRSAPEHWEVFVDPQYREVGIGYATDDQGVHYFAIDFGSRPSVLPMFINDGAEVTDSPQVALRLTNEEAEPLGEGNWIGKAIEVRISNQPDFEGVSWQPWEPLFPWALSGIDPGEYAVYVEYRDGAGRVTVAEDTIRLVSPGEAPPSPTPWQQETAVVTMTLEPPTPSATPVRELPPDRIIPTTAPPPESRPNVTPQPTWTPLTVEDPVTVSTSPDWGVLLIFALQGVVLILIGVVFLRQR